MHFALPARRAREVLWSAMRLRIAFIRVGLGREL